MSGAVSGAGSDVTVEERIARLREERVEREAFAAVGADDIDRWCAVFGVTDPRHRTTGIGTVAPPEMVTTFLRPSDPPRPSGPPATNLALHDRLKEALGLPVGIATGYRLECLSLVVVGDRLTSVERVAEVGSERATRFGVGRDWVLEVVSSFADGPRAGTSVCVERWHMTGYDPDRADGVPGATTPSPSASSPEGRADDGWHATFVATRRFIVDGATANRVWATAHHDDDAARAAGLPGIILDTSTWVALASRHAAAGLGGTARVGAVDLVMRRPVLVDDVVDLEGVLVADVVDAHDVRWATVRVTGRVHDRTVAVVDVRLAVATADGTDVWALTGPQWCPGLP